VIASDGATPPNIGTSGEITVTVDVTAPELTLGLSEPSDSISIMVTSDEALKQIPDVSVTGTRLSDNASIGPAAVTLVRIGVNTWVGTYGSDTETIVNGDYTVTITGEDKAGNKTNRTATFSKKSVTTDGESASVVQDAGTVLEIETNGAVTSDITVTQHMENPSGNVGNPEGADTPAAFVEINASAELRNNLKQIYIEVSYNPSELPAGTDESTLKLYLWDVSEGIWKAVPGSGVDTLRKVVFGTINHLSKYGAFGSIGTTPPAPPSTPSAPSGGGIPAITTTTVAVEGLTASVPLRINAVGIVEDTTDLSTSDEKASLIIDSGTTVLGSDGKPLTTLTAEALTEPPAPPTGSSIIAAYDFGPDGATFEPAINLVMPYDPSSLPEGTDEAGLMIAWWNGSGWEMLETVVDTVAKTVSAPVSHFTTFALIVPPAPVEDEPVIEEEPVIEDEEPVIEDEPVIDEETPVIEDDKPAVDEETPVEEPTAGIAWWVWMIIALAVIGAVTAVWTFWLKPRLT
jgi:hypothetical protein